MAMFFVGRGLGVAMYLKLLYPIVLLFAVPLYATDPGDFVARVSKYRGDVSVEEGSSGQKRVIGKVGAYLYEGERIVTGGSSFIKILMRDDTVFQLGSHSTLVLEKFRMNNRNDRSATYNMLKGKMKSIFVHKADDNALLIKAPSVSMGVRGTEILVDVYKVDNDELKTDISLLEGGLVVKLDNADTIYRLEPGEILQIEEEGRGFRDRLKDDIFMKLKETKAEGPFLHDVLRVHDNSFFKGSKSRFDFEVSQGSRPSREKGKEREDRPEEAEVVSTKEKPPSKKEPPPPPPPQRFFAEEKRMILEDAVKRDTDMYGKRRRPTSGDGRALGPKWRRPPPPMRGNFPGDGAKSPQGRDPSGNNIRHKFSEDTKRRVLEPKDGAVDAPPAPRRQQTGNPPVPRQRADNPPPPLRQTGNPPVPQQRTDNPPPLLPPDGGPPPQPRLPGRINNVMPGG